MKNLIIILAFLAPFFAFSQAQLVLQYPFSETSGNTAADISGNGFDLTLENNVDSNWETIEGKPGLKMHGLSAEVDETVVTDNMLGDDFTISAYIYRNDTSDTWGRIAGGGFNLEQNGRLGMHWKTSAGSWIGVRSSDSILLGTWTHVAVTKTIGEVKIYINGVAVEANTDNGYGDMANDSEIDLGWFTGFHIGSKGVDDKPLISNMKDFRFYTGVLGAAEILELATEPEPEAQLVLQYTFNETSGNTAADNSGNGFDLTLENNVDSNWETIEGMPGLKMHGLSAEVDEDVVTDNMLGDDFTISAYIYRNDTSDTWGRIAGGGFNLEQNGRLGMHWKTSAGSWIGVRSSDSILLGTWTHVAVTKTIGEVKIYINGVAVEANTDNGYGDMANDSEIDLGWFTGFHIGSKGADDKPLISNMSDFRFYTGVLGAAEISELAAVLEAKKISYITKDAGTNGDSLSINALKGQGYIVSTSYVTDADFDYADLDNSDLVVIGRTMSSSDFSGTNLDFANVTAPILNMSIYAARTSRLAMVETEAIANFEQTGPLYTKVYDVADPMFEGLSVVDDSIDVLNDTYSILGYTAAEFASDANNGKLLLAVDSVEAGKGNIFAARWEAGVETYPGSATIPSSTWSFFGIGSEYAGVFNFFAFTDNGLQMYLNEVEYLIEQGSSVPVLVTEIMVTGAGGANTVDLDAAETLQMTATVLPADADDMTVKWSVNDEAIATIDASGLLTPVAKGVVTVTATANDASGITGTLDVTITSTVGVAPDAAKNISLYYNSRDDLVQLRNSAEVERVDIFSITGVQLYSQRTFKQESLQINGNILQNGVFIVRMQLSDKTTKSVKFVK